ncbi:MAG TPA: hypothetical protein VHO69_02350 [Phototrophicaceae bacterium]|nr:hypothetical protein [Phototrophicaceae bacterium]
MMLRARAYDELLDFLTSSPTPEQIVTFTPSQPTCSRLKHLLLRKREGTLTPEEHAELDEFNRVEDMMRHLIKCARDKIRVFPA